MRHGDPADLHAAMLRAGLDPEHAIETMQAGTGTERILDDVASALASGVEYVPTLFVNEQRYPGELDAAADPVRIGFSISKTGLFASAAPSQVNAYELWRDQVNAQGGLDWAGTKRPIEFVVYDEATGLRHFERSNGTHELVYQIREA